MRNLKLYSVILTASLASSMAYSEPTVSGKVTYESSSYTDSRAALAKSEALGSADARGSDNYKSELSARVYIDGELPEINDTTTYHMELQAFSDSKAIDNLDGNESYTQRDALREAYVDTSYEDWAIRAGKQQVVWGTADGAKFLDIINPTDYSEMAQNQMEDSRIPVWLVNAEKELDDGGQFQVVVGQPRENYFSGLNRNLSTAVRSNGAVSSTYTGSSALSYSGDTTGVGHDKGNGFILKGVDTISGEDNGFLNVAPDLGTVATLFGRAFTLQTNTTPGVGADYSSDYATGSAYFDGLSANNYSGAMTGFTVGSFNSSTTTLAQYSASFCEATDGDAAINYGTAPTCGNSGKQFSDLAFGGTNFWLTDDDGNAFYTATGAANSSYDETDINHGGERTGQQALAGFAGMFGTNLLNTDSAINSTFEYMDRTAFATFDAFVGATSQYVRDMPTDADSDIYLRYKNTLDDGSNYSINFANAYDKNPVINVSWRDQSGNKLTVNRLKMTPTGAVSGTYDPNDGDGNSANGGSGVKTSFLTLTGGSNSGGYGGYAMKNSNGEAAVLRFTQTLERATSLGGSFDTTIETEEFGPVVLRAEGLYSHNVYQPVIDRGALAIGDLPAALTMRKSDRFKYVIGADITALTNMMVSVQFIQDINLDHLDQNVDFDGTTCTSANSTNCGVYTLDFANMHMTNGFQKAEKAKEFVSLYLSKPFGESGQHRWNNITMLEENGGRWNRLDVEYTIDDNTVATAEYNKYWGDKNTQFGQLEKSSNIQVGMKYTF